MRRGQAGSSRRQRLLAVVKRLSFGREDGQALMEFAVVVPVLLLILFGTIEFARIWNNKDSTVHLANEAARIAAVNGINSTTCTQLNNEATVAGLPGATITFATIANPPAAAGAIGSTVQATVSHSFTRQAANVPGLPANISGTASMRLEQTYTGPANC